MADVVHQRVLGGVGDPAGQAVGEHVELLAGLGGEAVDQHHVQRAGQGRRPGHRELVVLGPGRGPAQPGQVVVGPSIMPDEEKGLVDIRSRLSGYLSEIHFTDGQMVKKGDLLFTIDRRPFQIVLEQMRANLAQSRANLAFAKADLQRGQSLVQNKTITEQVYDQRTQAKTVAEASVAGSLIVMSRIPLPREGAVAMI